MRNPNEIMIIPVISLGVIFSPLQEYKNTNLIIVTGGVTKLRLKINSVVIWLM
jgi:hypothetical protein